VSIAAVASLAPGFSGLRLAQAANYYVSVQGDNNNPGTLERPFQTIHRGVDSSGPGDTVYVRAGTYHESISITQSGTPGAMITLSGYPGERPLLDGEYERPSAQVAGRDPVDPTRYHVWEPLVKIAGDYIVFQRFEVTRALGRGIRVSRNETDRNHDCQVRDCWIHDTRTEGILLWYTDQCLVENCRIYVSGDFAPYADRRGTNWPGGIVSRRAAHVVLRKNEVFHNWGEGILPMDSEHITIEDNVVYDNFASNIYCERTSDVLLQRNIVYSTNDGVFLRAGSPCPGMGFADEGQSGQARYTHHVTVINNVMLGNRENLFWWGGSGEGGFADSLIAHNTLVRAHANPGAARDARGIQIDAGVHTNCRVENNIILQDEGTVAAVDGKARTTIQYLRNLCSRTPGWSGASDANTLVGDPQLEMAGPTGPGLLMPDYFRIKRSSPAKDAAVVLPEVKEDFFGRVRGAHPDIGAIELQD
jgi:hypothetical protein